MPKAIKPHPPIPSDPEAMKARIIHLQEELDAKRTTKRNAMRRFRDKQKEKKLSSE